MFTSAFIFIKFSVNFGKLEVPKFVLQLQFKVFDGFLRSVVV